MKHRKEGSIMKSWIATLIIVATVAACGGSLAEATPTPEPTPEPTVEITIAPKTATPSTPNPNSANRIVCETIRTTVSGSLSDAVEAYNSGLIGLYDFGTIYNAWASGARKLNASASGAVRTDVERLIKLAEKTGNAGQSGYESATVDGVVAFAAALDSLAVSCP